MLSQADLDDLLGDEEPDSMEAHGAGMPAPMQEGEGALCEDCGKMHEGGCMEETTNEGWTRRNKDQLLFDRLVEKWIK